MPDTIARRATALLVALVTAGAAAETAAAGPSTTELFAHVPESRNTYAFAPADSVALAVGWRMTDEDSYQFTWPDTSTPWDTALLGIFNTGGPLDFWVEMSAGDTRVQQYFGAQAPGVSWFNLSGLHERLAPGVQVTLHTHGVRLDLRPAELRLFDNRIDLKQRILVLAPHPDDAEIAAFGLYADHASHVVTVTAGNAGDMNYRAQVSDPAEHYALKGYLRAVDSVTVPWQGQVPPEHTANLGYFDGRLDAMYRAPQKTIPEVYSSNTDVARYRRVNLSKLVSGAARSNRWDNLVADLAEILRKVNPQIIVMPDPRLDTHPDHEFTSVALEQALAKWSGNPIFLLYTNHTDSNHFPYGPAGAVVSLPPSKAPLSVQKVYSYPTSPALQIRKLFALDSMHDLRLSPEEQMNCGSTTAERRPDNPRIPEEDYFRRGPRANELFLQVDKAGLHVVIQDFLAHYHPDD